MKKEVLMIVLVVFVLLVCGLNNFKKRDAGTMKNMYIDEANIKEVNDNSYMGIELNQDSGLSEEESKRYSMDYPYTMYSEEGGAEYYCFRYPNNNFPLTVTYISIKDTKYNVFGIKVGDDIVSSEQILFVNGYRKQEFPDENSKCYSKGDVIIFLDYNETTIKRIEVSLDIETEEGVKY
ncbi:MAG: hypothetical protein IJO70_07100 [Lachnospiraceae bacterium]|nr:hypothetical protein [Lachnospiraceae bacterium]